VGDARQHEDAVRTRDAPPRRDEARASHIAEHSPDGICVISADDLKVSYANPACGVVLERDAEAVSGRHIGEVLPSGGEALVELLVAARDSGTSARVSNFRCGEGREWTVQVIPRLDDETGEVTELVLFIGDATEHRELVRAADRAAEAERRRADELDVVFASLADAVVLADSDGRIRKYNAEAVELFGLGNAANLTIASPQLTLSRPDGVAMQSQESPLARALRAEVLRGEEAVVARLARRQRRVSVAAAPVLTDGEVTGAVAVFHDISGIREAEERMERALQAERQRAREAHTLYHAARAISSDLNLQERLRVLAETMAEGVGVSRCCILLLEGETTKGAATFGMGEEDSARLYGFPERLACARGLEVVRQRRPAYVADAATDELSDPERATALNLKSVLIVPLVYGSRVTGIAYLDEPGTRRRFSESNRAMAMAIAAQGAVAIENARLYEVEQDRARMLEFMMAELNHRVKNNLAIVCGLLSLQLTEGDPHATKESVLRDCMARIQSIALIHQILHEEDMDAVDMKETARRIAGMACDTFAAAGQRITWRVRGDRLMLPCKLATSLGVAMNELICNAVKHGFAGRSQGRITVTLRAGDRIRITVSDDGCGVPADFDLSRDGRVGALVVTGLAEAELGGSFHLRTNARGGTTAGISFPRP